MVIFLLFFTSCSSFTEIENNIVVTACFAVPDGEHSYYSFYVSGMQSGGDSESEGSKSYGREYRIEADNFSDAITMLKNSGMGSVDLNHMSLFAGNRLYFDEAFTGDEKTLRKFINVAGLTYTAIVPDDYRIIIDCINSEYGASTADFSESLLDVKVSGLSSTLAELSFCINNKYYTSAIPEIIVREVDDAKLPSVGCISIFSVNHRLIPLNKDETETYIAWRKQNARYYNMYKIYNNGKNLSVVLSDMKIKDIASKYSLMNVDILNIKYYSMKKFLTYNNYRKFFAKYNLYNTKYECGVI